MKNKFLQKVLSGLLCVCVFFTSFTLTAFAAVPAWAVAIGEFLLEKIADYVIDNWDFSVPTEQLELKAKFIADMRKYALANNFTEDQMLDYLGFLYADWDSSFIDTYGENAAEIWNTYHEVVYRLCAVYFVTDIAELASLITAPDVKGYIMKDDGKVDIPASDLKDFITESKSQYFPRYALGKVSYRTDTRYDYLSSTISNPKYNMQMFYTFNDKFAGTGTNEMYLVFFYTNGTDSYYSQIQLHFKMTVDEVWYSDRDEIETYNLRLDVGVWDMGSDLDPTWKEAYVFKEHSGCDYFLMQPWLTDTSTIKIWHSKSFLDGYTLGGTCQGEISSSFLGSYSSTLINSGDITKNTLSRLNLNSHFTGNPTEHNKTCTYGGKCDIGYYASTEPIEMRSYNIDIERIPDNYFVTIQGDTLYDYSITNSETGQSDTINNYITNNYILPDLPEPDNSGTSGVGGNVTVGGKVDIGGSVGVDINVSVPDININVNTSGGGNGGDVNIGDYVDTSGATSDISGVISKLPQLSKGFTDYLRDFFTWLPPEIYGLVLLVLVVTVWKVFVKR